MSSTNPLDASGIYQIRCISTGRFYIGSAVRIQTRWENHRSELRRGIHHNRILQRAWRKYGEENFVFEVIEYVLLPELLTAREQYYLDTTLPFGKKGFNIAREAGSCLGRVASLETRAKQRAKALRRYMSPTTRAKIGAAGLGRKHSAESIERGRITRLGKPRPRGRKHTLATREKLRIIGTERTHTPETCEKLRVINLGNTHARGKRTDETRARMVAGNAHRRITLIVTAPDGTEYLVNNIQAFCDEYSLARSPLMRVVKKEQKQYKGWTARYAEPDAS